MSHRLPPEGPKPPSPARQEMMQKLFESLGPFVNQVASLGELAVIIDNIKTKEIGEVLSLIGPIRLQVKDLQQDVRQIKERIKELEK